MKSGGSGGWGPVLILSPGDPTPLCTAAKGLIHPVALVLNLGTHSLLRALGTLGRCQEALGKFTGAGGRNGRSRRSGARLCMEISEIQHRLSALFGAWRS